MADSQKPKLDNRIREVVYEASVLSDWLRSVLADLNRGDIDKAKEAIRLAIAKIGA